MGNFLTSETNEDKSSNQTVSNDNKNNLNSEFDLYSEHNINDFKQLRENMERMFMPKGALNDSEFSIDTIKYIHQRGGFGNNFNDFKQNVEKIVRDSMTDSSMGSELNTMRDMQQNGGGYDTLNVYPRKIIPDSDPFLHNLYEMYKQKKNQLGGETKKITEIVTNKEPEIAKCGHQVGQGCGCSGDAEYPFSDTTPDKANQKGQGINVDNPLSNTSPMSSNINLLKGNQTGQGCGCGSSVPKEEQPSFQEGGGRKKKTDDDDEILIKNAIVESTEEKDDDDDDDDDKYDEEYDEDEDDDDDDEDVSSNTEESGVNDKDESEKSESEKSDIVIDAKYLYSDDTPYYRSDESSEYKKYRNRSIIN